MKKLLAILLVVGCVFFFAPVSAWAEGAPDFNWEDYSLDELLEIREGLDTVIAEKQREYAIKHGDRKILMPTEEQVYVGGTLKLTPEVEKVVEDAPDNTKLVWKSSDDSVATVSAAGDVRGISKGEAVITCSADDNEYIFAECKVNAVLPVTAVAFSENVTTALLFEGKDNGLQLGAVVSPEDAFCQDVEWVSSNEDIASVDEKGYVTLKQPGNVTITLRSLDSFSPARKEARLALAVKQAASSITLDQTSVVMNMGSVLALRPTVLPENTGNKTVTWESSAPEIVTVNNGQLRAVACGKATITCTAADGSGVTASCEVEVIQMVTNIRILDVKTPQTLNMNAKMKLKTEVTPDYATNKALNWESSDPSVVKISDNGNIEAVGGGTAVITCTATDGSGKKASATIFVPSIAVKKDAYTVTSKDGLSFDVEFYGKRGDFNITPTSTAYFTVSGGSSGNTHSIKIIPLRAGKAAITLQDKGDAKNNRTISITIDHSAVYDNVSYPQANYANILRDPYAYKGDTYSIYGKVLQVDSSWGQTVARVGTGGYGYYDNVFYVTMPASSMDVKVIEDDMITIYGECTGTKTYTTIFGASVTIPSMTAEKVILGRGN